jgi:hypothetical protein
MNAWDLSLLHQINTAWSHPVLDWLMPALSAIEAWLPLIILAVLLTAWRGGKRARIMLLCLGIAIGLGDGVISNTLKKTIGRVRPRDALAGITIRVCSKSRWSNPANQTAQPLASPFLPATPSTCSQPPRLSPASTAAPACSCISWQPQSPIHASTAVPTGPATSRPRWPSASWWALEWFSCRGASSVRRDSPSFKQHPWCLRIIFLRRLHHADVSGEALVQDLPLTLAVFCSSAKKSSSIPAAISSFSWAMDGAASNEKPLLRIQKKGLFRESMGRQNSLGFDRADHGADGRTMLVAAFFR